MPDISSIQLPDGNTYDIKDNSAVKTVNNTAPDANGNVSINTGGSYTAGNGIDITNNIISQNYDELTSVDLNTVTYNYQGIAVNCTNIPSALSGITGAETGSFISIVSNYKWSDTYGAYMDKIRHFYFVTYSKVTRCFSRACIKRSSSSSAAWSTWQELSISVNGNGLVFDEYDRTLSIDSSYFSTVATTGDYSDLTNTPTLATVATSGSYNDLTNTPSLATVATTGDYSDLTNTPTLATVATSGSYNDLSNKLTSGNGISITNGTISNVFGSLANPDLDDITYNYQGYGYGCTNIPSGESTSGQICVLARSQGNYCTQLYFPYNSRKIYIRKLNNGTWGTWVVLYSADTLSAGEGISLTNDVIVNTGLNAQLRKKENIDLNTITDPGTYYVIASDTTTATSLNFPNGTNGLLVVARTSSTMTRQFYFRVGTVNSNDHMWYCRENNGTTYGNWLQIWNSKSFDPSTKANASHTHGYINNDGTVDQSSVASGDQIVITDASYSSKIVKSNITFGTSTTTFLSNKGTWLTPTIPISMELLWTNSSPTSSYSAKSVSLGAPVSNVVYVEYYISTARQYGCGGVLLSNTGSSATSAISIVGDLSDSTPQAYSRNAYYIVSSTTASLVHFYSCVQIDGTAKNGFLIPIRIWALKTNAQTFS